jgi:hypothetical protein
MTKHLPIARNITGLEGEYTRTKLIILFFLPKWCFPFCYFMTICYWRGRWRDINWHQLNECSVHKEYWCPKDKYFLIQPSTFVIVGTHKETKLFVRCLAECRNPGRRKQHTPSSIIMDSVPKFAVFMCDLTMSMKWVHNEIRCACLLNAHHQNYLTLLLYTGLFNETIPITKI